MASSLVMDGFRQRPLPGGGSKTSPLKRGEHSSTVLKRPSAQPLHPDDDDKMSSLTRAVANEPEPNVKLRIEAAYRPTTKDMEPAVPRPERWATMAFAVLGVLTRFFRISAGKYVLWDEAHFGKFGSHYLKHTFYFDVHPPLGKMLVGLAGYLAGYDGSFEFGSGSDYPSTVNYVGMRLFLALFSALAVPMAYLTAVQLRLTRAACYLVGLMTLLDVGFIGIGRLVLLDSMLVFFTTATAFYYCQFRNQQSSRYATNCPSSLSLFKPPLWRKWV
jgi:dolichyl-phosphate-mannose-protein mannosyltransferase